MNFIVWQNVYFQFLELTDYSEILTKFRRYPITRSFGDSTQKDKGTRGAAPARDVGVWAPHEPGGLSGWSPPNIIFLLNIVARNIFPVISLLTRLKCISEDYKKTKIIYLKKNMKKKFATRFFSTFFFFHFLRIFWNICRSEFEWYQSKTNIFVDIFFQLEMKMLLNEYYLKNRKTVIAYMFQNIAHLLGPKTQIEHFFGGKWGLHVVL